MSDLQAITDHLGEQLSRSVAIDDPQMQLQSYSPHYGAVDEQRLASILHRKANPEAIEWAHRHGVQRATSPLRIPGNTDMGMLSRVCIPIRIRKLHLGYLWLIDPDESLTADDLALAERAAEEAGNILYRESLQVNLERSRERELLRDLLDDEPAVRAQAVAGLADDNLIDTERPARVIALDMSGPLGQRDRAGAADVALVQARRLVAMRHALHLVRPDHAILVVAADRDTRPRELATRISNEYRRAFDAGADLGAVYVGIGTEVAQLADAHVSYHQARQATLVARALALPDVVEWSELGIYRLLAELPLDRISIDSVHPALATIIANDTGNYLVDTLETFLDLGGDIKTTAERLVLHRTTLYGRLAKIETIGNVDLRRGVDRLALHLGLKIGHLTGQIETPARVAEDPATSTPLAVEPDAV